MGPPLPTRTSQRSSTLAAERPSARLSNDETDCVAKGASVCEQRSLDPIAIIDGGLLGRTAGVTHGVEAMLQFYVSVFTKRRYVCVSCLFIHSSV